MTIESEQYSSRTIARALGYSSYQEILPMLTQARRACNTVGESVLDNFSQVIGMVRADKGIKRHITDTKLSPLALCLLFQTPGTQIKEDRKRRFLRHQLKEVNKKLNATARKVGNNTNDEFSVFHNNGYLGLYNGKNENDIHALKRLKKSHKILDYMGSAELAQNLLRSTWVLKKIYQDNIHGKDNANKVHFEVGSKVREIVKNLGGVLPEKLPVVSKI